MGTTAADGLLLVDKPAGVTSHDVVAIARRALGLRRAGHAGTLDPFATGLLVILAGRATRLLPYLDDEPKVYDATIAFGAETDTDDRTGARTHEAPPPDEATARAAAGAFTGFIEQVPPAFSAKQVGGRRAYDAARKGEPLALSPVRVTVHEFAITAWRGAECDVTVSCSGGTYIRALARDLGRAAGSAAHLAALRRTRAGRFRVEEAATLDALEHGAGALRTPREAVATLPSVTIAADAVQRAVHGMLVEGELPANAERAALVDAEGALVAIAERAGTRWQPRVVLRDA